MGKIHGILLLLLLHISCSSESSAPIIMEEAMDPVTPFQPRNVLFIGNSHTQNNQGIDFHVRGFLQNTDLEYTAHVEKMALGGYTLEDHLNDENTNNKISELEWDIIVLQENTFVVVNDNFKAKVNIENFKYRINNEATQLYLFMTWAYEDDPGSYQLIKNVYEEVAPLVDGTIVAVGTAFRAITVDSSIALDLYNIDGVHATLEGSYLAAAMFYKAIYNKDPTQNSYNANLEPDVAIYLKDVANQYVIDDIN